MDKRIVSFLLKYFFILKAVADGWRVKHTSKNTFEFYMNKKDIDLRMTSLFSFVNKYGDIARLLRFEETR